METRVKQWLADLGDTHDAVANSLRRLGVRGIPTLGSCPLAVGLTMCLGLRYVLVIRDGVSWDEGAAALPPACQAFISRFDEGCYPFLHPEPEKVQAWEDGRKARLAELEQRATKWRQLNRDK